MPIPAPSTKDRKGRRRQRGRASAADMIRVLTSTGVSLGTCTRREYDEQVHPETCPICIEIVSARYRA